MDEAVAKEVSAIDYLLQQLPKWREREIVHWDAQKLLEREYGERREQLIAGLKPEPKPEKLEELKLEPEFERRFTGESEGKVLEEKIGATASKPFALHSRPSIRATPVRETVEATASKPFTQVVTENINLIFTLASLLFVVGVLLYYRHEIYTTLQIPYVQAAVLGLVTTASLFTGWTLVRRGETVAGRALTVLGSLLVPINPWFMVKTGILKDSGNSWILGSVCTLLYLWTAYFLRDRLFIYFGLFAGYLTGISLATKLGVFPSYIAGSLMLISVAYLLVEGALKRYPYYAPPFFNTAHVGILLCLMFYTPAIKYLPVELVAARLHFDPSAYHFPTAFWLSLTAAFIYVYSAFSKNERRFIFFAYASLFWGEALLITNYSAPVGLYVLIMAGSTLLARYLSDRWEYDSEIKSAVEIGSRGSHLVLSLYAVGIHVLLFEPRYLPGWTAVAAVGMLGFYSVYMLIRERHLLDLSLFWGCAATVVPFASLKGGTAAYWTPVLVMATAAAILYLLWEERDDREHRFHRVAFLVLIGLSVLHLFRWAEELADQHLAGVSATLLLSLLTGLRAWRTPRRVESLVLHFISAVSVTVAFALVLEAFHLDGKGTGLTLISTWSLVIYLATRGERFRLEMRQSYGVWVALLNTAILFSALVMIVDLFQINRVYVLVALMLVGICETLCVSERRSILHTLLASVTGILLVSHLLIWTKIERAGLVMAAFGLLGLCYLYISFYLERVGYPAKVAFTLELVANLTVTAAALVTISMGLDREFIKLSLLAPALSAAFYFYGAGRSRLTTIYCYLTPLYASATFVIALDIFLVDRLLPLASYLIALSTFWYWLDGRVGAVFEKRLETFALWFMPLVLVSGCLAVVSEGASKEMVFLFCCESTAFYVYTSLKRGSSWLLSAAVLSAVFTVYAGVAVIGWEEYGLGAIAVFAVVLAHLSKTQRALEYFRVLEYWARGLFFLDTGFITIYALSEMELNNPRLSEVIVNILLVKVSGLILRVMAADEAVKSAYRGCVIYLTTMTYLLVGLRLGFDFWKQNEFYSVPVGLLYLAIGLVSLRRNAQDLSAKGMVWAGGFTATVPMLLHTLSFRFIDRSPSSVHEIGLIVLSLALMFMGFMFQLKAPTVFGATSLAICLFSIVFGFVGWEQRWLSIVLIALGASIFITAWLIYYFSNKKRVDEGKHLMEEFGKWK